MRRTILRKRLTKGSDEFTIHITPHATDNGTVLYHNIELRKNGAPVAGTTGTPDLESCKRQGEGLKNTYMNKSTLPPGGVVKRRNWKE